MFSILAASSLHQATKNFAPSVTGPLKNGIYGLPGRSFNPNALKARKTA